MDEEALVARILAELGAEDDDVARLGDLVLKIDGMSGSSSMLSFHTPSDLGWRSLVAALSDIAVKLAKPVAALASITAPSPEQAYQAYTGVRDAAAAHGVAYIGGDVNSGRDLVVDVAALGMGGVAAGRRAPPGTLIITPRAYGYTGLVFKLYPDLPRDPVIQRGVEILRRPRLEWPSPPPPSCIRAAMDSSDGLGRVLWSMARRADIVIEDVPAPDEVAEAAKAYGVDLLEAVFNGGEEYLPVYAVDPDPRCVPEGYAVVGKAVEGAGKVWMGGVELRWRGWAHWRSQQL